MRSFVLYTAARLALLAATFGLIWLAFGWWLSWDAVSILYTAIIAMVVSSVIALFALGSLRNALAVDVSARADRAKAAYDAMRAAEDEPVSQSADDVTDRGASSDESGSHSPPA